MSDDDRKLMQCIQNGETGLFERLVEKYRSGLLRFARSKLIDPADAEDIVQEAIFAAYEARDSYNPEFAFSTWLWTILLNLSHRWRHKTIREKEIVSQAIERAPRPDSSPAVGLNNLLSEERNLRLIEFLAELPESQADAIRLKFFGDLTFQEIADTMNCSLSGAKKRVKSGLLQLSEKLRDSGDDQ
ncbi:MAG TPA: RNA polymerase sigma factor [Planctomycetaceae bacterium]|nr:RNA polymerase sigma factor [Planctomycetaceae bacterium]